jgi:hypothetical protein
MTVESEKLQDSTVSFPTQEKDRDAAALEDLFLIGSTRSNVYTIYKDNSGKAITVQFRSLQPTEIMAVANAVERHQSPLGKYIAEEIETLARAIIYVNNMPLVLTTHEREKYFKENNRIPTPLDNARTILQDKIKSPHILDAMFEAYGEFIKGIQDDFDNIKKKLTLPDSSNSTS